MFFFSVFAWQLCKRITFDELIFVRPNSQMMYKVRLLHILVLSPLSLEERGPKLVFIVSKILYV